MQIPAELYARMHKLSEIHKQPVQTYIIELLEEITKQKETEIHIERAKQKSIKCLQLTPEMNQKLQAANVKNIGELYGLGLKKSIFLTPSEYKQLIKTADKYIKESR